MAERPNAANRLMVKRPLADTNSVISEPIVDKGRNTFEHLNTELQLHSYLPPPPRFSSTGVLQAFSFQAQVLRGKCSACSWREEPGANDDPTLGPQGLRSSD